MTLIIAAVSHQFGFLAADRRVMLSTGQLHDDHQNKIVVFESRLCFAYTGLAQVGQQNTDLWLAKTLSQCGSSTASAAIEHLRESASRAFAPAFRTTMYRHAFVGAGWTLLSSQREYLPLLCWVSNFHDENAREIATPSREFSIGYRVLAPSADSSLESFGQRIPTGDKSKIYRRFRGADRRRTGPEAPIRILADGGAFGRGAKPMGGRQPSRCHHAERRCSTELRAADRRCRPRLAIVCVPPSEQPGTRVSRADLHHFRGRSDE